MLPSHCYCLLGASTFAQFHFWTFSLDHFCRRRTHLCMPGPLLSVEKPLLLGLVPACLTRAIFALLAQPQLWDRGQCGDNHTPSASLYLALQHAPLASADGHCPAFCTFLQCTAVALHPLRYNHVLSCFSLCYWLARDRMFHTILHKKFFQKLIF